MLQSIESQTHDFPVSRFHFVRNNVAVDVHCCSYVGVTHEPLLYRDAKNAGSLEIHWPSGEREAIKLPEVDRIYTVTEGNGITGAVSGARECEKDVRKAEAHR